MVKISLILSFLAFSCVVQAQENKSFLDQKVNYQLSNQTIAAVLKTLESDYQGLVFVYSSSTFDMDRKVSGDFQNIALSVMLKEIFKGTFVEFRERNAKVIIRPRPKPTAIKPSSPNETKTKESSADRIAPKRLRARRIIKPSNPEEKPKSEEGVKVGSTRSSLDAIETGTPSQFVETQKKSREIFEVPLIKNHQVLEFPDRSINPLQKTYQIELIPDSTFLDSRAYVKAVKRSKKDSLRLAREEERLNEEKKFRAYASAYTGYTQLGSQGGIQIGGSLVWLKNKRWGIGLSGYAVQRAVENDQILSSDYRLAGGYGGVLIEYTPRPSEKFHLSFPLLVGAGGLAYVQQIDRDLNLGNALIEDSQAFAVIEPGVALETNLLKFLRVGMSLSYRYTTDTSLSYQNSSDQLASGSALNSLSFGIVAKIGIF